jgi:hypothetical protein
VDEIQARGRRGLNTVVLGRLAAGTYLLSPRSTRGGADLARVVLALVPGRKSPAAVARPRCGSGQPGTGREVTFKVSAPPAATPRASAPARPPSVRIPRASGVLGAAVPALEGPRAPASDEVSAGPGIVAVTLVLAALLSLIGMFAVVRRELRPQPAEVLPRGYRQREPGRWVPTELATGGPDVRETYEPVVEAEPFDSGRAERRPHRR